MLLAALRLFHERGIDATSVDDVLAAAEAGKGSSTATSRAGRSSLPQDWSTQDWIVDLGDKIRLAEATGLIFDRLAGAADQGALPDA